MEYLNFDLEIQPRSEQRYPVAARSEAGEAHQRMDFPLEGLELDNTLLRVQNALLRAGNVRRGAGTPEEQTVQSFGRTLFEALLAEDVRRLYDASAARATQQGKGLRLRLRIQAPELAALPWEFLYDPLQDEYVCFLPDVVIVRHVETTQPIPPFKVEPPLRVLAMIANPSDQDRLDLAREKQRLIDALHPLEQRGLVKLRWVEGQTVQALHQALLQRDWHIFHYIGHGAFNASAQEGLLALVNEQGSTHLLSATDLGRLLAQRPALRLVVLNACQGAVGSRQNLFSSTAAALASKRIPAVLAMQYDITDQAAVEFTRGFYEALAVGIPVDGAVTQARTAISVGTPRTLEWVTPVLYMRSSDGVLFDLPPLSQRPSGQVLITSNLLKEPTKLCPRCNDRLPEDARFCGRCGLQFPSPPESESTDETPPLAPAKTRAPQKKLRPSLVALVLLAALAGSGGVLWSHLQSGHPTGTGTPTRSVQNGYPNAPHGTLVINDPLSQLSHWVNFSNADGACQFRNGAYHISTSTFDHAFDCVAQGQELNSIRNFTFEVQMQLINGDCGGLVFRDDGTSMNNYLFDVCRDGSYSLFLGQQGLLTKTLRFGASSALHTAPNQYNTLAVVATGNVFALFVNKQEIATGSDNTYSYGDVGLLARDVTNPTEAAFSNAKVWLDTGS